MSFDWFTQVILSLISGLLGVILGFIIISWRDKQKHIRRTKIVSTAFLIEIKKYQDFFRYILTDFNPSNFEDADSYKNRAL